MEVQILKDKEQKIAYEKEQLETEVQDLQNKLKFEHNFLEELEQRQNVLYEFVSKTRENIEMLGQEQTRVKDIGLKLQNSKELQQTNRWLAEKIKSLEKEKTIMENELIESNAKYETLRTLMAENPKADCNLLDIMQKFKFLQYENRCKKLTETNKKYENILETMTATVKKEIETNAKLLAQIEDYEARLQEFKTNDIKEESASVINID